MGSTHLRVTPRASKQRLGCRGQRRRPDQLGHQVTQASLFLGRLRSFGCSWFYNGFSKCSPSFNAWYARTCRSLLRPTQPSQLSWRSSEEFGGPEASHLPWL